MFTIRVIPISRGTSVSELTYFSSTEYPLGTVLSVPLRKRNVPAVVMECVTVRKTKTALRTQGYALKKIPKQKAGVVVTAEFVRAAQKTADHHGATVGAVLFSYLPKALLSQAEQPSKHATGPKPHLRGFIVPRLYQGLAESRTDFYRTAVREAFAAKGSVLLVAPTVADAERVYDSLSSGIEKYGYLLHSNVPRKNQVTTIQKILSSEHPVLVVATPSFLSLPRHDLTTLIVEREGSSLYRTRTRPYVDVRVLAHNLASELGGQLFLADLPLRVESVYRRELGEYEEVVTGHHRMHFPTRVNVYSQAGESRPPKKQFQALSSELVQKISSTAKSGGRTFLYVARRGLSPVTVCGDCGVAVTCTECDASVILHRGSEENYFLCHSCGAMRHARERCVACTSWRLETLGVGTELVLREIEERLPKQKVSILSSDTAKSHAVASKIVKEFYSEPRSVLVGTELALPYLTKHVPLVGVVSLDSLLSLASWNIYERIASTLTRLREMAGEELFVQTRHPETDIFDTVLSGNFSGFYRSELRQRKKLGYPPYSVIIKVSVVGTEQEVTRRIKEAKKCLEPYELITFSHPLKVSGGKLSLHGFLHVPRESWPDEQLVTRLRALPASCAVMVDPDSIL